jgi:hypothetical protein
MYYCNHTENENGPKQRKLMRGVKISKKNHIENENGPKQ